MIIVIKGIRASGKTRLAVLLHNSYKALGRDFFIIDEITADNERCWIVTPKNSGSLDYDFRPAHRIDLPTMRYVKKDIILIPKDGHNAFDNIADQIIHTHLLTYTRKELKKDE